MKKLAILFLFTFSMSSLHSQTDLIEAVDFHVKTVTGETIKLFPLLDDQSKIVVIDFFSTSCGPCQDYAPDFQNAYEMFDSNNGNVYFMGINFNNDNDEVIEFDSIFGLTYPSVSGLQGGGDNVYEAYNIMAYPTVIVITPDHQIVEQSIWPPTEENIINSVYSHGGLMVGNKEINKDTDYLKIFPNPTTDLAFLTVNSSVENMANFKVIDQYGRTVFVSESILIQEGNNQIELPVEELMSGIYFVTFTGVGQFFETIRFVVAK